MADIRNNAIRFRLKAKRRGGVTEQVWGLVYVVFIFDQVKCESSHGTNARLPVLEYAEKDRIAKTRLFDS